MNGFTAADMTTAAANGHADGYQAGYADAVKAFETNSAQQPIAEIAWSDDGYKIGLLGPLRAHRLPIGTKLYAAPVAAAPSVSAETLRALSERWATDRSYTGSPVDDIRALIDQPTMSTPAAPGIDLEQFRKLHAEMAEFRTQWGQYGTMGVRELDYFIGKMKDLIDASPKGGYQE